MNTPTTSAIKMVPVEFGGDWGGTNNNNAYGFEMYGVVVGNGVIRQNIAASAIANAVGSQQFQCVPVSNSKQISSKVSGLKTFSHTFHCMGQGQNYYSTSVTKLMNGLPVVTSHTILPVSSFPIITANSASIKAAAKAKYANAAPSVVQKSTFSSMKAATQSIISNTLNFLSGGRK